MRRAKSFANSRSKRYRISLGDPTFIGAFQSSPVPLGDATLIGNSVREDATGFKFFVHASGFVNYDDIGYAVPGMLCEFEVGPSEGREFPRAQRVRLLDSARPDTGGRCGPFT
jgi:hypothetical protein